MNEREKKMLNKAFADARADCDKATDKKVNKIPPALAIRDALFNEEIHEYNGHQIDRFYSTTGAPISKVVIGKYTYITQNPDKSSPWATIARYTDTKIMWIMQPHTTNWKRWVGLIVNGEVYQFDTNNYGVKQRIRYAHLLKKETTPEPEIKEKSVPEDTPPETITDVTELKKEIDHLKILDDAFATCVDDIINFMEGLSKDGYTDDDITYIWDWAETNKPLIKQAECLVLLKESAISILNGAGIKISYDEDPEINEQDVAGQTSIEE